MNHIPSYKNSFRILKGGKISLVVSSFLASTTLTFAAPSGGTVTSGSANISQNGKVTDITQSTQKASINWNKFNIASDETVNFKQPNSSSITLNRVVGNEKSIINGALNANGQVWIINSNGVLFGKGASINTSGLLATTKDISDSDFQAGNYKFTGNSKESVINLGTIDVINSGSVILAANEVRNEGTIKAIRGKIHLAGADEYTVNLNGNSLVNLIVNKGVLDALVKNSGTIISNGGEVYLTTNAVNELLKGVVNNTGVIEANSLAGITGHVELFAHGGTANVAGTINATDGFVETSGDKVKIADDFKVKADKWLIDPKDFTIAASGGDMTGAKLSSSLEDADIEIQSVSGSVKTDGKGDINVNDTISWSSDKKLTLNAQNDIFINKEITSSHANGKLELLYGQKAVAAGNTSDYHINAKVNLKAGENFITKLGSDGATTNWTVVDASNMNSAMNADKTKNYALGGDVILSGTDNWTPIGDITGTDTKFTGKFDGLGHTISNLNISNGYQFIGLFGITDGATIQNIGVVDADIQSNTQSGILVGYAKNSTIKNSYTTGKIIGTDRNIGGLVGTIYAENSGNSYVENSYSLAEVEGKNNIGGLVGSINAETGTSTISNSYATGKVTGTSDYVGGLVGYNKANAMTGNATANISNSYATGSVSGANNIGGLVGSNSANTMNDTAKTNISNSYATGSVSGGNNIGGLVGSNSANKMMGTATAEISGSYWNTETTGQQATQGVGNDTTATGVSGKTTEQMMDSSTYDGWDTTIWSFVDGSKVEGYSKGGIAYLTGVTREQDIVISSETYFAGGFGTAESAYTITNWTQLQNINNSNILTKNYYLSLINNLDNLSVGYIGNIEDGWNPIGNASNNFNGTFDGKGFTISNLYINRPTQDYIGLFGYTNKATIKNIGLKDVDITGNENVGALVGTADNTHIENVSSSGKVVGGFSVGGLVGYMTKSPDTLLKSHSSADVSGTGDIGGLVGRLAHSAIRESYATGKITGTGSNIGGIVGESLKSTIENSYATGNIDGTSNIGGLVGRLSDGKIENSYATGEVPIGSSNAGLIGYVPEDTEIINSFFDTETTKQTQGVGNYETAEGVSAKTTAQMQNKETFKDWDIEEDSTILKGTPFLAWQKSGNSYTKIWVIGTKEATPDPVDPKPDPVDPKPDPVDPKPDPVDPKPDPIDPKPDPIDPKPDPIDPKPDPVDPKPDPKPEIKKIVDSITNQSAITINLPNVEANTTPNNIGKNVNIIFVQGENQMLVSRPIEGQSTQRVSLSEARQMQIQNGGSSEEVIVPLSNSSIIQLIDGGVNLPSGVEQEFYLADAKEEK